MIINQRKPIIVEGPDGAGKSIIATQIAKALELPLIHEGGPPRTRRESSNRVTKSILNLRTNCVCDRVGFVSSAIYGKYRYQIPVIPSSLSIKIAQAYKPIVVYCKPTQLQHKFEEYDDPEYLAWLTCFKPWIKLEYDLYMRRVDHLSYDWIADVDGQDLIGLIERIASRLCS